MKNQKQRVTASFYSLFTGDALSMPVHWFYRASDIIRYFPPYGISKMEPAPNDHPSSIMSLHSTQAGGRRRALDKSSNHTNVASTMGAGTQYSGQVVGDIILKGKAEYWGGQSTHYHHGLKAGDNTLNAYCARLMMRHLVEQGGYHKAAWLEAYIAFMTADPAQHPDTYAESYHRGFFANLKAGMNPEECGALTHDTPSMGALVTVAPLAYSLFKSHSLQQAQAICCEHVQLTHPDDGLMKVVCAYVSLLHNFFHGNSKSAPGSESSSDTQQHSALNSETIIDEYSIAANSIPGVKLDKLLQKNSGDASIVGGLYSTACYISDSWPSVCYLAAKYHSTPGKALLINTNLGGENAHRGAVLGSLVGAAVGQYDESLFSQLLNLKEVQSEVQQFNDRFIS